MLLQVSFFFHSIELIFLFDQFIFLSGHLTATYYDDSMCSMYITSFDILDTDCLADDDDDNSNDGDDDDDYVDVGVISNTFCT